jgi:glycosyltransferase involved in cell wall biosynthesis
VGESSRPALSYRHAIERMLERADAVVCSTEEQATNIALLSGNVHPILDLHGEFDFLAPTTRQSDRFDIVWEGLPMSLAGIRPVLPAIRSLARTSEIRLHLVTDLSGPRYMNRFVIDRTEKVVADWGVDIRLHQWSVQTLTEVARQCDVAIVPIDLTDPLAVGKPENRMRIFWRLGVPVVVSANPSHIRAADLAGLDDRVVCSTIEEWEEALVELSSRPDLRLELASAGQAAARSVYSEESIALRWDRVIDSLQR